jgi:hypothetical protein
MFKLRAAGLLFLCGAARYLHLSVSISQTQRLYFLLLYLITQALWLCQSSGAGFRGDWK